MPRIARSRWKSTNRGQVSPQQEPEVKAFAHDRAPISGCLAGHRGARPVLDKVGGRELGSRRISPPAPKERTDIATTIDLERKLQARRRTVAENLEFANAHDVDRVLSTFAANGHLEVEAGDERHPGVEAIRGYYENLFQAVPDVTIEARAQHETEEAIIVEGWLRGTHSGNFGGLPGTERRVACPLCIVFRFDEAGKLAQTRIYYDRATLMQQIGILHP